jgi:hypothetical protein
MRAQITAAGLGAVLAGGPVLAGALGGWVLAARVAATLALLVVLAAGARR